MPAPLGSPVDDPVRRRRELIAKWNRRATSLGYLLYVLCSVAFVWAFATNFDGVIVDVIIATLIAGSVLLAPAIVIGYAVKAAEREDREAGL